MQEREKFKVKAKKMDDLLKQHIVRGNQTKWIEKYNLNEQHKRFYELCKSKKKKNTDEVLKGVDNYHFFFTVKVLEQLIQDQSKEPDKNIRSIIQFKLNLKEEITNNY
jgi:hypothetical protein